jgi:alkanesulfonate monooxygenase SsuD/methylene tetrahydromethanopterin reductase-like flavin-dependent oxidoreductase (luciferase family)
VLGAIAETTSKVGISTGLTCPIMRYYPAIIAQAAATVGVMSEGRFTLAIGAGERLNEHVVGQEWPPVHRRHAMLREAAQIIRLLWQGDTCSYEGEFFHLDSARIYDLPKKPIPLVIGISGEKSAQLAADVGDGIMAVEPKRELVKQWTSAGGGKGPRFVRPEDLRADVPHGPDVEPYVEAVRKFTDAGFDHIVLLAVGPDQDSFIRFFETKLAARLRRIGAGSRRKAAASA